MADGEAIRPLIAFLWCVDLDKCPQLRAENVSRETFSALIFLSFSVISVFCALTAGTKYSQNAGFLLNQYRCGDFTLLWAYFLLLPGFSAIFFP